MDSWDDPRRFARFAKRICAEYALLGQTADGVRFLYGPASSLNKPNGVVILGINPGGEVDLSDRLCTAHTAYYSETWTTSDYQSNVRVLMEKLFTRAGAADWQSAWDKCLTSNLIPFRSASLGELADPKRCKTFGRSLWRDIFKELAPRLIIGFGAVPRNAVIAILREMGTNPRVVQSYRVRRSTAQLWEFNGQRGAGRALLLPHYAHGHGVRSPRQIDAIVRDFAPQLGNALFNMGMSRPAIVHPKQPVAPTRTAFQSSEETWRRDALARHPVPGWYNDVIKRIPFQASFCIDDIFADHGAALQQRHPGHSDVRSGIRTILGLLTKDGIVVRVGWGRYTPAIRGTPVI